MVVVQQEIHSAGMTGPTVDLLDIYAAAVTKYV